MGWTPQNLQFWSYRPDFKLEVTPFGNFQFRLLLCCHRPSMAAYVWEGMADGMGAGPNEPADVGLQSSATSADMFHLIMERSTVLKTTKISYVLSSYNRTINYVHLRTTTCSGTTCQPPGRLVCWAFAFKNSALRVDGIDGKSQDVFRGSLTSTPCLKILLKPFPLGMFFPGCSSPQSS